MLAYLVARPGQVVARQDLIDAIWKDAFVTDTSLAEAVSSLRQALGDDPQQPVFIQTLHRRGYRFVAPLAPARGTGIRRTAPCTCTRRTLRTRSTQRTRAPVVPSIAFQLLPWSVVAILTALVVAAIWKIEYADPRPEPRAARFVVDLPAGARLDATARDCSRTGRLAARLVGVRSRHGAVSGPAPSTTWTPRSSTAATVDARRSSRRTPGASVSSPGGKLRTISLAGGTPLAIADADARGGTWREDGRIVFAGGAGGGLAVVGENGGRIEPLTRPEASAGETHLAPFHLPRSRRSSSPPPRPAVSGGYRAAIVEADGTGRTLVDDASGARVAVPGLLVLPAARSS